jgi:hypothetical protein
MQVGTKVIRKADAKIPCTAFGVVTQVINDKKVRVLWTYNSRQNHSDIAKSSLLEVSPEMEQDIRVRARARYEARRAEQDRERIYLCTNVNPLARVSNDGHHKPLPLALGQTVNMEGKLCWYCKHPVVLREQA